jgi:hypothetical protein
MKTTTLLSLLVVLSFLFASPAFAGDDPVDLLAKAKTAETVERDVPKAIDLYRRAMLAGTEKPSLDAALALARLQEERGESENALSTLVQAAEHLAPVMDDATKRKVQEGIARLLPPGASARGPYGLIEKGAEGPVSGPSPLDQKIRDLLSRLDTAAPNEAWQVQQQIQSSLEKVGRDAMPVLERMMYSERPERARVAAEIYARIGAGDAVEGLEKAIRTGDGFTRDAGLRGLESIYGPGGERARVAEAADRLLALERLSEYHDRLVSLLVQDLPGDELLARHRQGGPDAGAWLRGALQKKAPGALERALDLAKAGGEPGQQALAALLPLVFPGNSDSKATYGPDAIDAAARSSLLDVVLAGPNAAKNWSWIVTLLRASRAAGDPPDVLSPRVTAAWRLVPAFSDSQQASLFLGNLGKERVGPPLELFADPTWAQAFFGAFARSRWDAAGPDLISHDEFWTSLFDALPRLPEDSRWVALQATERLVRSQDSYALPPPKFDERWLGVLALEPFRTGAHVPDLVLRAAARSGRPEFLEYEQRMLRGRLGAVDTAFLTCLQDYRGPGLREFAESLLREQSNAPEWPVSHLFQLIMGAGPEGRADILAIASDWNHPQAIRALNTLIDAPPEELTGIAERVRTASTQVPERYRSLLIAILSARYVRGAVPYLLGELRSGLSDAAAKALDRIREYYDKLSEYEAWAKGGTAAPKDLADLLKHPDADVRRAAAISLGALGVKDALPALVRLGAEDPDPSVRKAALAAVEKIGR